MTEFVTRSPRRGDTVARTVPVVAHSSDGAQSHFAQSHSTQSHFEPFLHLVDVTHRRALVAWGGFFFHRPDAGHRWKIVDDRQLAVVDPGRTGSIGARSEPYGVAVVEAFDETGAPVATTRIDEVNHAWLEGLEPDTVYTYRVRVDGSPWAEGERWDWGPVPGGGLDLAPRGRSYRRRFRTHPAPDRHR
jgi:tartrate-resistant acid phosphatase type 5